MEIAGIIISLCILEALLIVGLLVNRSRRRRAEVELERFAQLADFEHRRLAEIVTNVPGSVWETMVEPETNLRKSTFESQYVEKMLGYSMEEWLTTPGFGMKIIHEEDRFGFSGHPKSIFLVNNLHPESRSR